jgi:flagellar biosynthetic protein FliQ
MDTAMVVDLGRQALWMTMLISAPLLGVALVVGLIIGIFQAATSINEATLTFVPKLVVVVGVLALSAPFMISTASGFFAFVFSEVSRVNR